MVFISPRAFSDCPRVSAVRGKEVSGSLVTSPGVTRAPSGPEVRVRQAGRSLAIA